MGDDLDEDIARTLERIAEEEARTELAGNDLVRWQKEREAEAERELRELEARLGKAQAEPLQPNPEEKSTKPEPAEAARPELLERFENLDIPSDTDEGSTPG